MNVRKDDTRVTVCILTVIVFVLMLVGPNTLRATETVTLNGEVEAADYDEDGTVIDVAIFDGEWGSVLVLRTGKGAKLLNHVGAVVSATGEIRELDDESGYLYSIEVTSYSIDSPVEPEEDLGDEPEN
jgi:hypothetical protein